MKYGVTGTRRGWTHAQEVAFKNWILVRILDEWHHGDCKGVDEQSSQVVKNLVGSQYIHCHPPSNPKHRAFFGGAVMYLEEDYMTRNQEIVNCVDHLVVIPKESKETIHSGTWTTCRMAFAACISITIFYPNGIIATVP